MQIKKILKWVLFVFFVYAVVTSPTQAASLVSTIWEILLTGLENIGHFFDTLLNRN